MSETDQGIFETDYSKALLSYQQRLQKRTLKALNTPECLKLITANDEFRNKLVEYYQSKLKKQIEIQFDK